MGAFGYLADAGYLSLLPTVAWVAIGAGVAYGGIFLFYLARAPFKQRNEARARLKTLEAERIPQVEVRPTSDRRDFPYEHEHLMWAEIEVKNTSSNKTLENVSVQIVNLQNVMHKQGGSDKDFLIVDGFPSWRVAGICWSERFASPPQLRQSLDPGQTKIALIAFCDDSNGGTAVFNTLNNPKPRLVMVGAKIQVIITSHDSSMWEGEFYIECHPNYLGGSNRTSSLYYGMNGLPIVTLSTSQIHIIKIIRLNQPPNDMSL